MIIKLTWRARSNAFLLRHKVVGVSPAATPAEQMVFILSFFFFVIIYLFKSRGDTRVFINMHTFILPHPLATMPK